MVSFFSIIIPTLNEELFLPKILSNLKTQKEKNFEVIIVDANSIDKTEQEALKFRKDLHLHFFRVKKRNLSYQRNYGAKKATGNFLVFLDADVTVYSSFIKRLRKEIEKHKHLAYLVSLFPQGGSPSDKLLFKLYNFIAEVSQNFTRPISTGTAMIFQKDFFEFIGGYTERKEQEKKVLFLEDQDIILKASQSGVRAKFMRSIKVGFSLRRMKKEGRVNVMKKYITSVIDMTLIKGKSEKQVFHEMGGQIYNDVPKKAPKNQLEETVNQIKKFLKQF